MGVRAAAARPDGYGGEEEGSEGPAHLNTGLRALMFHPALVSYGLFLG